MHGGISRELALVATLPQLEYPRAWPPWAKVVGPLMWEPPSERGRHCRAGARPLVLVAPSTAQDPELRLLRASLEGLAEEPVRVLATYNGRLPRRPLPVPANATVVEWLSYSRTMPHCDLVICHAGHGTLVRALTSGSAGARLPVGGRHERERRPAGLGGCRGAHPPAAAGAAVGAGGRAADPLRRPRSAPARGRWRAGPPVTTAAAAAAELLEAMASPASSSRRTSTVT